LKETKQSFYLYDMIDPIDNPSNYKFGIFYFNSSDSRFIVPKKIRSMGYTFNFGHRISIIIFLLITAGIFYALAAFK